jgi:uncharacterized protein Veg
MIGQRVRAVGGRKQHKKPGGLCFNEYTSGFIVWVEQSPFLALTV